jgi:glycosyltransferase involved in cell wall biosynthesis
VSPTEKIKKVAVVIPAYKVKKHIAEVVGSIGPEISSIIVVDDACPEESGDYILSASKDKRLIILKHPINLGVGAAMKTGYRHALDAGMDIVIKIDGDGQMDAAKISTLIKPLIQCEADYTKGNRFYYTDQIRLMPKSRIIGNIALSFFSKLSSGYWNIFDPNNGFTAINSSTLGRINLEKISDRYFFESDMLFHLNLARAVVLDVAMPPVYGDEISNLSIRKTLFEFPLRHTRNFFKRIFYSYVLRDFTIATLSLFAGLGLTAFGTTLAAYNFFHSQSLEQATPTGTLVLILMTSLSGLQLLLSFLSYDIQSTPNVPLSKVS